MLSYVVTTASLMGSHRSGGKWALGTAPGGTEGSLLQPCLESIPRLIQAISVINRMVSVAALSHDSKQRQKVQTEPLP